MTATPAATSPHGWVSGPNAMANAGDMLSMPACHFGVFFGGFGWPNLRHRRQPITSRTAPMRILTARAMSDGAVLFLGGLLPVTSTVTATTIASDASHPKMNAAPFLTPPWDAKTRMNAVNGIGSRLMTKPIRTRSRISTPSPCYLSSHWRSNSSIGHVATGLEETYRRAVAELFSSTHATSRTRRARNASVARPPAGECRGPHGATV